MFNAFNFTEIEKQKSNYRVKRVDELLGEGLTVAVLKMDVENFECRAIDGMGDLLRSVGAVQTEATKPWPTEAALGLGCHPLQLLKVISISTKTNDDGFILFIYLKPGCQYY